MNKLYTAPELLQPGETILFDNKEREVKSVKTFNNITEIMIQSPMQRLQVSGVLLEVQRNKVEDVEDFKEIKNLEEKEQL